MEHCLRLSQGVFALGVFALGVFGTSTTLALTPPSKNKLTQQKPPSEWMNEELMIDSVDIPSVSVRNGNFYRNFVDAIFPGNDNFKISRVYNTKTIYSGPFGHGWGFEYAMYLEPTIDGGVKVREYGSGADNTFYPLNRSQPLLNSNIQKIIVEAKKLGSIGSSEQEQAYLKKLQTDSGFRQNEWKKYLSKNHEPMIAVGTKLKSIDLSYQMVEKIKNGYVRAYAESGVVEEFNEQGRLVEQRDRNGFFKKFTYSPEGRLVKVTNQAKYFVTFNYNAKGLIESIHTSDGQSAEYQYNPLGELVKSKDTNQNTYTYTYDTKGRHNLISIRYADNTQLNLTYYDNEYLDAVKTYKDRKNNVFEYTYTGKMNSPGEFKVMIQYTSADKKTTQRTELKYTFGLSQFGELTTRKFSRNDANEISEFTYDDKCELPIISITNNVKRTYGYDQNCRLIKKTTPGEVVEIQYSNSISKVSSITKTTLSNKQKISYSFDYDEKGNLKHANNHNGKEVILAYDRAGNISTMATKSKILSFQYDELSRPIKIIAKGTNKNVQTEAGKVDISYNNDGSIKDVKSDHGEALGETIMAEFQSLLELVDEATVSL